METTGLTFKDLAAVIGGHFNCSADTITPETVATDIHGWDSLEHAIVIMKVETHFNTELPEDRIFTMKNVGELCDLIQAGS